MLFFADFHHKILQGAFSSERDVQISARTTSKLHPKQTKRVNSLLMIFCDLMVCVTTDTQVSCTLEIEAEIGGI